MSEHEQALMISTKVHAIFGYTQKVSELRTADIPDTDLSKLGSHSYGDFEVRRGPVGMWMPGQTSSVHL